MPLAWAAVSGIWLLTHGQTVEWRIDSSVREYPGYIFLAAPWAPFSSMPNADPWCIWQLGPSYKSLAKSKPKAPRSSNTICRYWPDHHSLVYPQCWAVDERRSPQWLRYFQLANPNLWPLLYTVRYCLDLRRRAHGVIRCKSTLGVYQMGSEDGID